jgi:hypothetical protein
MFKKFISFVLVLGLLCTLAGCSDVAGEIDGNVAEAAKKELENRYYCPTVTAVKSIKERMGHFYFETIIDGKEKSFTVRDITRNLRHASDGVLLIFDMDGNRYIIPDFEKIESKSKRLLEPYLY